MSLEKIIEARPRWVSMALIILGCLMMLVSVQKTISLSTSYFSLTATMESFENYLEAELPDQTQVSFEEQDINTILFKTIGDQAKKNKLMVRNISTPVAYQNADLMLITGEVILEGDFVNVQRCLDQMRKELKWIKISSLKFEREMSAKNEALYTKAYFQLIKKNEITTIH